MIWGGGNKGSVQEADETQGKDLWFWYRAGAGVLTAIVGVYAAWTVVSAGFLLAVVVGMFSSRSPVTFSGPNWGEFGPSFFLIAALGLLFFGHAGYAFARNGNKGRKRVWVASILGLPVGVYGIWVLLRTRPGTNNPPPEKKTALVVAGGIGILLLLSTGTGMFTNNRIQEPPRQPDESALLRSIRWDGEDQLQQLLEEGADPNAPSHLGTTPLMYALNTIPHYRTLAPILLEHGANPNTPSWRYTYRHFVSLRANEMKVHEVDMHHLVRSYRKETPLVVATRHGDLELIKLMIAKGADVNGRQSWKDLEMPLVDLMIKRGARIYTPQLRDEEPSALEVAADSLHEEAFALLLQHGATVDSDILGRLSHSVFSSPEAGVRIVTALIDRGADVNAAAGAGPSTPLMAATRGFNVALVRLFLQRGANPNQYSGTHSPVTWIESLEWGEGADKEALTVRRLILEAAAED